MKFFLITAVSFIISLAVLFIIFQPKKIKRWEFQSIDTMKYSRDQARETLNNHPFTYSIDQQITDIARTGATHVAIDTPYDDEFLPVLKLWVQSARRHKLKVFFRGNLAGWEGWFGYHRIDGPTHTDMIKNFIVNNADLFEDGDVFSSCPECEIGAGANKKNDAYLVGYKSFLKNEYSITKNSFVRINKQVKSNYYSMTGDFAFRIMDREMTKAMDGLVVIDHYVLNPVKLASDLREVSKKSGGQVVLGEFGAPIPDLHGSMTESEQRDWIEKALYELSKVPELHGINYWVNVGGSTSLWTDFGQPKEAVGVITAFFTSNQLH